MPAPYLRQEIQQVPLKIAGGNNFGRYGKISREETFNMIVSKDAQDPANDSLVIYAGYKNVRTQSPNAKGRGIISSKRAGIMLAVWGNQVYTINKFLVPTFRGNLTTSTGEVFLAENNGGEIAITDKTNLYIYNYNTNVFSTSGIDFTFNYSFVFRPGYISFQNGRFLVAALGTTNWVLSGFNDGTSWPNDAQHIGELQTKADSVQAPVPMPGGGNVLFLFGSIVGEKWTDIGAALFPYQRASTFNIDYGCINATTIAELENYIVWIAINDQSGPVLMVCNGGQIQQISTEGIDFKLSQLTAPEDCVGFLFKQDGHLIYQFTFITDNLSYIYDFNTQMFFTVTDENWNYHIARKVVFFNNKYYFVSLNGGNLYEFGTQYTKFIYADDDIKEVPRTRISPPVRLPSARQYIMRLMTFTIENGQPNDILTTTQRIPSGTAILDTESSTDIATEGGELIALDGGSFVTITNTTPSARIDLAISRDGGATFGSSVGQDMNPTGQRKNLLNFQKLGQANDSTYKIDFWGFERFIAFNGLTEVYQ